MCLRWLASRHDPITKLNDSGHAHYGLWFMEFGLKTFIGQKDKKLKDVWKKGVARPVFKNKRYNLRNNSILR